MNNKNQLKLLIVDDEERIRMNLQEYFIDEGFIVNSMKSGEEVLKINNIKTFDVAIVDMRLPGIDGGTLISRLKKIKPGLICLIYTGSTNYSLSPELKDLGILEDHVFIKPLNDMQILVQKIFQLVGGINGKE